MFRSTLLSSIRSLMKSRGTTLLNVLALTIAIGACMIAYSHIRYELSFDKYHSKQDRIFRVVTGDVASGDGWVKVSTPIPVKMKATLPEIDQFCRITKFSYNNKVSVKHEQNVFNETLFYLADPSVFEIFDFNITNGTSILPKSGVAISNEVALKYFGQDNPIGKSIQVDGRMGFEVSAVFEKLPNNSHFDFDFIASFENLEEVKPGTSLTGNWGQFNYFTYVLLKQGADHQQVEQKLKQLVAEYGDNETLKFENLGLQALSDIHFQHNRGNAKPSYNTKYLYIYGAIALAILIISFVNFMNLSVASSTKRIKEVGVRKVLGATKTQLTSQFVAESVVTTVTASVLAVFITSFLEPYVNEYTGANMQFHLDPLLLIGLVTLILLIALFSGIYISLYILSFNPISAVKGFFKIGNRGKRFKASLLTVQFAISCILILSSLLIYQQLNYIRNHDLGMNQDGIVTLQLYDQTSQDKVSLLVEKLEKLNGVSSVAGSRFTPGTTNWHQTVSWKDQKQDISWNLISVDENFPETFGLEFTEGTVEDIKIKSNSQKYTYIINEAALRETGWEYALGQEISPFGEGGYSSIAAVAKNFNYKSLHNPIEPVVLFISENARYSQVSIRFNSPNITHMLASIEWTFREVLPETPFEYEFVDDQFSQLYTVEKQTGSLVGLLTLIAITLAMMGVYSLLTFAIKERTREIAIRKILGIKIKETVVLLSGNYLKLMVLGNVIGLPITWYAVQIWLQNFTYQISMEWVYLLFPPVFTLILMIIVVGIKTQQVQHINPVKALRYE